MVIWLESVPIKPKEVTVYFVVKIPMTHSPAMKRYVSSVIRSAMWLWPVKKGISSSATDVV